MKPEEIAIVYFSHAGENYNVGVIEEGNTAKAAAALSRLTGAKMYEIQPANTYPQNYSACIAQAKAELKNQDRPSLKEEIVLPQSTKLLFLGYPNWWGEAPMAVFTFLESNPFKSIKIAPFCTHEGSGISSTLASIAQIAGRENVLPGVAIQGKTAQTQPEKTEAALKDWLKKLNLN